MSKIIETVKRAGGEMSDLIRAVADVQDKEECPGAVADRMSVDELPKFEPPSSSNSRLPEFRTAPLRVPAPSPLLPFESGQWRPSEQYRILRTKIVQHPKQPRIILVSSPAAGDGKSVTSVNMAASLSLKSEAQVLLLDADLRNPTIHRQLGLPESPGLAEALRGDCRLEEAIVRAQEFPNLFVLPAGAPPGNPVELLDSTNWQGLCDRLRGLFRYVVLDSPPVGAVADYALIQAVSDGVIVVLRPDHTNRKLCDKALSIVPKEKFLGVLLNCVPDWVLARDAGSDYYYSSEKLP